MRDKEKTVMCFSLAVAGWLVFIGGVLIMNVLRLYHQSAALISYGIFAICTITALLMHLTNCTIAVIALVQRNEYKKTCISALSLSGIYIVCFAALLIFAFWDNIKP